MSASYAHSTSSKWWPCQQLWANCRPSFLAKMNCACSSSSASWTLSIHNQRAKMTTGMKMLSSSTESALARTLSTSSRSSRVIRKHCLGKPRIYSTAPWWKVKRSNYQHKIRLTPKPREIKAHSNWIKYRSIFSMTTPTTVSDWFKYFPTKTK